MMLPSKLHEQCAVMIGRLIDAWSGSAGIDIQGCRTMTIRREDLSRGFEPDNCYYVAHEGGPQKERNLILRSTRRRIWPLRSNSAGAASASWRFTPRGRARSLAVRRRTLQEYVLGTRGRYQPRPGVREFSGASAGRDGARAGATGDRQRNGLARSFRQWAVRSRRQVSSVNSQKEQQCLSEPFPLPVFPPRALRRLRYHPAVRAVGSPDAAFAGAT